MNGNHKSTTLKQSHKHEPTDQKKTRTPKKQEEEKDKERKQRKIKRCSFQKRKEDKKIQQWLSMFHTLQHGAEEREGEGMGGRMHWFYF